ncbi:MAG: glycosyltransferase [Clostridia bacterium]|nr:glycosyltransferase [Clostridia bacterium]
MISVVIAVYKGSKHIEEQIMSILPQLKNEDEIIVSDDRPGGITERIVKRIAAEDSRVIWVEGKNKGSVANIVNALRHCKGEIIYFAQHKDVWLPDKVKRVNEAFSEGADLVLHNAYITDELLNITEYSLFEKISAKRGVLGNIGKNSYYIPCIAIRRKMLKKIMPIPRNVPDVGQWIGLICEIYGKVKLVDIPLIYCRVSSKNKLSFERELKTDAKGAGTLIKKLYKRVFFGN